MPPKQTRKAAPKPATEKPPETPAAQHDANVDDADDEKPEELQGSAGQASKDMKSMAAADADPAEMLAGLNLGNDTLNKAVQFVAHELAKIRNARTAREAEIQPVTNPEDVELLVNEAGLSTESAEALLRKHEGNLDAALRAFVEA